jgi:hypothetical protein
VVIVKIYDSMNHEWHAAMRCGVMLLGHSRDPLLLRAMATLRARTYQKNHRTATLPPYYYNHHILDKDQSTQVVNNHKYLVLMGLIIIVAVVLSLYTVVNGCRIVLLGSLSLLLLLDF